ILLILLTFGGVLYGHCCSIIDCPSIYIFILSVAASGCWAMLLCSLRPYLKIEIVSDKSNNYKIYVKVINNGCSDAVNLRIEAAFVKKDEKKDITYHLKPNMEDFLILPSKYHSISEEYFRIFSITDKKGKRFENATGCITEKLGILRIRVHAYHSFSGFGKAFEQKFNCDFKNKKFTPIN
ncbi:MAG TPA: hypothetical protein PLB75_04175, partial [Paludibacteraceae bacterium]|nr:hypothetical protein [Paludibacteraceae bacterium]